MHEAGFPELMPVLVLQRFSRDGYIQGNSLAHEKSQGVHYLLYLGFFVSHCISECHILV